MELLWADALRTILLGFHVAELPVAGMHKTVCSTCTAEFFTSEIKLVDELQESITII